MFFQRPEITGSYTKGLFQTVDGEMAKSRMGDEEASLNNKQKKKIQVKECDISIGDGTVDLTQQDIDDLRCREQGRGGDGGPEACSDEDRGRPPAGHQRLKGVGNQAGGTKAMKRTVDIHQQDINDPRVLGTRLAGTKTMKKTKDDHRQDINDPRVLGTRLGGTKAKKKTKKTVDNHQQDINDLRVLETRLGGTMKMTKDNHQ